MKFDSTDLCYEIHSTDLWSEIPHKIEKVQNNTYMYRNTVHGLIKELHALMSKYIYKNKKGWCILKPFIKVREAAEIFGIGRNLLYEAIKKKELRAYRPNCRDFLLKASEIEAWIESKVYEGK